MKVNPRRRTWQCSAIRWSWMVSGALLLLGALTLTAPALQAQSQTTPTSTPVGDLVYTVRPGDSWIGLAQRFGLTVRELQAANPQSVRPSRWLLLGEKLTIPGAGSLTPAPTQSTQVYVVQPGEGWSIIAKKFGLTTRELQAANPRSLRAGYVLYRGESLIIPAGAEAGAISASQSPTATVVATSTRTTSATPTATQAQVTPTTAPTDTPTNAPTVKATATLTPTTSAAANCPSDFADYPELLLSTVNDNADDLAPLEQLLQACGAQVEKGSQQGDWTGDGQDDLVVVYANPHSPSEIKQTDLIIFNRQGQGFVQGYRAKAAGEVKLLATDDINADNQPDVVWQDTTCGSNTCFTTVEVVSWDGRQWRDWTSGAITMAYTEVTLQDSTPAGQGQEILLSGGVYGSAGAGPQRSREEVWVSREGEPYSLQERTYAASNCLYHAVIDANEAFLVGAEDNFAQAETLYTRAATDKALESCWTRDDELTELRSFSLFRLALTAAYQGKAEAAMDVIGSLRVTYPDSIYAQVGQSWLGVYQAGNDIGGACSAANQFATENPAAWQALADYGFANPTFEAADVCPVLDVEVPASSAGAGAESAATRAITTTATLSATTALTIDAELACPADLGGYPAALLVVLAASAGDQGKLANWLRQCDALSNDRGGVALVDANGDGLQDAIFWPTVISDLGFGPKGAQGDLLIYHGQTDGAYQLVVDEEIYGQPILLASEDLNGDGQIDLAWQIVGCSTFCVLEVQVVSWDGEGYASLIQPGATIAEGAAEFQPVSSGDPGGGKQLVLVGGVSGTAEGGLAVPHREIWQSVDGEPFRRIRWTYDRETAGADCLGLRLIEADVALQAAKVLGYQEAINLYSQSIDPRLNGCSIFGMKTDEELILLQGLASFRLVQAQALAGELEPAQTTLDALTKGQPDSDYTTAATQWLAALSEGSNGQAACQAIQTIFDENVSLWQVTDHFGYNHPALAAEQICFAPEE
jgi:LysM repeat protein